MNRLTFDHQSFLSTGADGALDEGGVSVKIAQVFSNVVSSLKQFQISLQQVSDRVKNVLRLSSRGIIFKGKIVTKTTNCGKQEDVKKYRHAVTSECLAKTAEKYDFQIDNALFMLEPHSKGVCYGASLWFSRRCLETQDISSVAKEFEGGVPYEGVLLHGCYRQILGASFEEKPSKNTALYLKISKGFSEKLEQCSTEKEKEAFLTDEKAFDAFLFEYGLNDNSEANSWLAFSFVVELDQLKTNIPFPSFIQKIVESKEYHLMMRKIHPILRKSVAVTEAIQDFAGLASSTQLFDYASPSEILDAIPTWERGIYEFTFPVYSTMGSIRGHHSVVLVKEEERNYLFDANFGLGYEDSSENALVERLFTFYCGEIESPKKLSSKTNSLIKRINNLLFLRPNSPLSGKRDPVFSVQQMHLSPRISPAELSQSIRLSSMSK